MESSPVVGPYIIKVEVRYAIKLKNARHCSDYLTISLMSHTLKILLKVIHFRMFTKLDIDISGTRFGFRKDLGIRKALFVIDLNNNA